MKLIAPSSCWNPRTAAMAAALFGACSLTSAQITAYDTETPAWIDFEFTQIDLDEGDANGMLTVFRYGDCRIETTVHFRTVEDTATEGRDYKGTGGTLVFRPGETQKSIRVAALADDHDESTEAFSVQLEAEGSRTVLVSDMATVRIHERLHIASAPSLQIQQGDEGSVVLSWEADGAYILQCSPDAAGEWKEVPFSTADVQQVSISAGALDRCFYRLFEKQ